MTPEQLQRLSTNITALKRTLDQIESDRVYNPRTRDEFTKGWRKGVLYLAGDIRHQVAGLVELLEEIQA